MIVSACRQRVAVALIATLVLVLQSLASAWANAAPVPLDAFGNPLCIGNSVDNRSPHPAGQLDFGECCTMACSGWANIVLPPSDASLQVHLFRFISEPFGNMRRSSVSPRRDDHQGNPRAPPVWC